ncbi:hypothetical protein Lal_00007526 [Lupinus albus]|uniref:Putative transcription factor HSF-type-DNA-binding family n=1 Tax=Lupinus albus TaxID=3870 RepID=A0A6A5MIY5_LUPAL|nr:putative transcription factor HSF-type-DNA-binding family [Lupinus albus]KAF1874911.1 hypothetical protein Lal_00007526 [Lupinus albus]
MSQRSVAAPFLTKTYDMVDDPVTDDVISWSESGNTFVVWKNAEFAKDLVPKYFKHNNFSSFVRQLNTYGFRKIVADKWEFANEHFKRGHKHLLSHIKRRKTTLPQPSVQPPEVVKSGVDDNSPSNSEADDMRSTFTSTPDSKKSISADVTNLSSENHKLKKENETLISELAHVKNKCDELVVFLRDYLKVDPDKINRILGQGSCGSKNETVCYNNDQNVVGEGVVGESGNSLKLFGVWLKEEKNNNHKKRECQDQMGLSGPRMKELKTVVDFSSAMPVMKSNEVCN